MRVLSEKECVVITAALDYIDRELRRCYWNKNQKELESPFQNTGNSYECDAFKVRAYNWMNDNGDNFVYFKDDLHVDWYKYCGRGMYVEVPNDWMMDRLPDMVEDCVNAITRNFDEGR